MDIFASQGAHHDERPNTLGAFRAASALDVDGVELDVRETADGHLVVHHNPVVGDHVIARSLRRQLPHHVPTLEAVLDAVPNLRVNVEVKNYQHVSEPTYDETGSFARAVARTILSVGETSRVTLSCFDLATCDVLRALDDRLVVRCLLWDVLLADAVSVARTHHLHAVHPRSDALRAHDVTRAHDAGLAVVAWTAREPASVEQLIAWHVDCLITDDPAGALATRDAITS